MKYRCGIRGLGKQQRFVDKRRNSDAYHIEGIVIYNLFSFSIYRTRNLEF